MRLWEGQASEAILDVVGHLRMATAPPIRQLGGEPERADKATMPRPASYYSAHKYLREHDGELSGLSYANAQLANIYGSR